MSNLCSHKKLSPTSNLVSGLIIRNWPGKLRICFLKALTDYEFGILLLRLFNSVTVDEE